MNPNLSPYDSARFFLSGTHFILRLLGKLYGAESTVEINEALKMQDIHLSTTQKNY